MDYTNFCGMAVPIINSDVGSAERAARAAMTRIDLDDYQTQAAGTAIYPGKGTPLGLIYCGLKLAGEAGEVSEKIGKAIRDDGFMQRAPYTRDVAELTPERREALKLEAGDCLWYLANIAEELGCTLSEIAQANLDKLADRKARGVLQGSGDNR